MSTTLDIARKPIRNLTELRQTLALFEQIPGYEENPDFYKDWGEKVEFSIKVGVGECAR